MHKRTKSAKVPNTKPFPESLSKQKYPGKGSKKWSKEVYNGAASSMDPDQSTMIKVVVIGESGAGKSNLISRLTEDKFDSRTKSTIGIDFALYEFVPKPELVQLMQRSSSQMASSSNKKNKNLPPQPSSYKSQIWDTAGQERYRSSMTKIFYRDVSGAILAYDITKREHFNALNRWLNEIRSNVHGETFSGQLPSSVPIVLVGNKLDQAELYREVQPTEGELFVQKHNLVGYVETSAKLSTNVSEAFALLFNYIVFGPQLQQQTQQQQQQLPDEQKNGKLKSKSYRKMAREDSIKLGSERYPTYSSSKHRNTNANNNNNTNNNGKHHDHRSKPQKHSKCSC